jgi:hypothetical protein
MQHWKDEKYATRGSVSRSYETTTTGASALIAMHGICCLPALLLNPRDQRAVREMLSRIDNEALQFVGICATHTPTPLLATGTRTSASAKRHSIM